jgi:hypothetical protein
MGFAVLAGTCEALEAAAVPEINSRLHRGEESALRPKGDAADGLGQRGHLELAIEALDRGREDVDPPQRAAALVPQRAFAQAVGAVHHAFDAHASEYQA